MERARYHFMKSVSRVRIVAVDRIERNIGEQADPRSVEPTASVHSTGTESGAVDDVLRSRFNSLALQ